MPFLTLSFVYGFFVAIAMHLIWFVVSPIFLKPYHFSKNKRHTNSRSSLWHQTKVCLTDDRLTLLLSNPCTNINMTLFLLALPNEFCASRHGIPSFVTILNFIELIDAISALVTFIIFRLQMCCLMNE